MGNTESSSSKKPPAPKSPATVKSTEAETSRALKLSCAVSSMKGWRPTMEDQHVMSIGLTIGDTKLPDHCLFAVFDGHGGSYTSAYLKLNFTRLLCNRPEMKAYVDMKQKGRKSRSDGKGIQFLKKAVTASYVQLDKELRQSQKIRSTQLKQEKRSSERSGSTAIMVLLTPTHIVCANVGDSRAILRRSGSVFPLSFDHKPSDIPEKRRIVAAGGYVKSRRVDGDLAVSRAFGDFMFKDNPLLPRGRQKVIVEPDFMVYPRDLAGDEFIILACDGVWDVASNVACSEFVQNMLTEGEADLGNICEEALDTCLDRKSRDNMTMMLVGLPALKADTSSRAILNNAIWGQRTSRHCKNLSNVTAETTRSAFTTITSMSESLSLPKPTLFAY